MNFRYTTCKCADLEDKVLKQCSDLFSNHYGHYTGKDKVHAKGQRIRLGIKYYMGIRTTPDMYVSLCYADKELIGQAFFLKKEVPDGNICTWVTQLVVNKYYRGKGVATRLLHSAWGFSDYFAWGLATANALTVKVLENVTWRKVDPVAIAQNIDVISKLCDHIPFARAKEWNISNGKSQIFTNFFPEQEKTNTSIGKIYIDKLGKLQDGYEWLAFTFQTQPMMLDEKHLNILLEFSAQQLNDAYGRMDMQNQKWAGSTKHEIDHILSVSGVQAPASVLDLGSGIGRHTIEMAKRGYQVVAVEPSDRLMDTAMRSIFETSTPTEIDRVTFLPVDGRKRTLIPGKFDLVICLYDVIGSYRSKEDNISLLETIAQKLRKGGRAVISIMNMDLTKSIATNVCSIQKEPQRLLRLRPSDIMQRTGNIFNPDYFLLDEESHLVFRKEQFEDDGMLSTEYIIADYRFTKDEFIAECTKQKLSVLSATYVQLGHWDIALEATDPRAKEILFVLEKQ